MITIMFYAPINMEPHFDRRNAMVLVAGYAGTGSRTNGAGLVFLPCVRISFHIQRSRL